ncbi:hypothetical protein QYM36_010105, partial [Artemia franciscana]
MSHQTKPGKRKFINKKGNWPMFKQILQEANYNLLEDFSQIDDKVKMLNKIMMEAAYKAIPKTSPNIWTPTGNKRIKNWWNELCSTAVEAKNVAKKAFQRHPSMSTAIEYKRSSAKVKKTCLQAKREAWEKFMTNIDHQTAVSKIHQYVSKMNGKRMTLDDRKYEIKHQGQLITSDFLKADIFANTFMKKPLDTVLPNPPVCVLPSVAQHKKSLMLPFSLSELQTAIERCNLNSAPGYDEIHIKWLIETPDIFRAKLLEHKVYKENKEVPKEVRVIIDEETFKKSREYGLDRSWFGMVAGTIKQCINTAFVFYWGQKYLWRAAGNLVQLVGYGSECEIVHSIAFGFLANAVSTVLDLPFSIYNNFVIEEKHGFNKQTYGFYFKDKLKKFLVSEAISLPIVASVVWIVKNGGNFFFVYLWGFVTLVILALMTIYPDYIAPLFDKYTPLPDGDLKAKIESLAASIDFPLYKLYVVEGSKRSSHSNAYFYGFFKNKRIVLFDTLLEESEAAKIREASPESEAKKESEKQDGSGKNETKKTGCTTDEVLAVLGHELGHWKLNHVLKNIIITEANLFLLFLVFNSLFKYKPLYVGFGFDEETPVFIGLYIVMSYILAPYNT